MLKKAILKSIKLFRQKPLKTLSRNFTLKTPDFDFEDTTEFDFSDEKNFQSEFQFSENEKNSDLSNLSLLLNPNNLQDIETFLNSLESKIPRQSIGIFLKVTCHIIKRTKNRKEISKFLENEKMSVIIKDMLGYFEDQALDSEFVDYLQFLYLAKEKGFRNKSFFGINFENEKNFVEFFLVRIMNENYDIRSLTKILLFERYNFSIRRNVKIKILKEIRIQDQFDELEDFFYVRIFEIICQDANYLDDGIFIEMMKNKKKFLTLEVRNLAKIFNFMNIYKKKNPNNENFMEDIYLEIEKKSEDIDFFSISLLLKSFTDMEYHLFINFKKTILEKALNDLKMNPSFAFIKSYDLLNFFSKYSNQTQFSEEYKTLIEILNNIDANAIPLELFFQKKQLLFLLNSENKKIRNDLQPFFENVLNSELERRKIIKFSPILSLINKDFLIKIWPNILNNTTFLHSSDILKIKIIAIQNKLEFPSEYEKKIENFQIKLHPEAFEWFSDTNDLKQQQEILKFFRPESIRVNYLYIQYFNYKIEDFQQNFIQNNFRVNFNDNTKILKKNVKILFNLTKKLLKEKEVVFKKSSFRNIISILKYFILNLNYKEIFFFTNNILSIFLEIFRSLKEKNIFLKEIIDLFEFYVKNKIFFSSSVKLERDCMDEFFEYCEKYNLNSNKFSMLNRIYNNLDEYNLEKNENYLNYCFDTKYFKLIKALNFLFLSKVDLSKEMSELLKEKEQEFFENLLSDKISLENNLHILLKFRFYDDEQIINLLKDKNLDLSMKSINNLEILKVIFLRYRKNNSKALADFFKPLILNNLKNMNNKQNKILKSLKKQKFTKIINELDYNDVIDGYINNIINRINNIFSENTSHILLLNFIKERGVYFSEIFEKFNNFNGNYRSFLIEKMILEYFSLFDKDLKNENLEKSLKKEFYYRDLFEKQIILAINNYEGEERREILSIHVKKFQEQVFKNLNKSILLFWLKKNEPEIYQTLDINYEKVESEIKSNLKLKSFTFKNLEIILKIAEINFEIFPKSENLILSHYFLPEKNIYLKLENDIFDKGEIIEKIEKDNLLKINSNSKLIILNCNNHYKNKNNLVEELKNLEILDKDFDFNLYEESSKKFVGEEIENLGDNEIIDDDLLIEDDLIIDDNLVLDDEQVNEDNKTD